MSSRQRPDTATHLETIAQQGFTVVPDVISPEQVAEIRHCLLTFEQQGRMPFSANDFEGFRTARLYNLLNYSDIFTPLPIHEKLLAIGEGLLDKGLLLSSISAIIMHPGETAQPIHADTQLLNLARPHVPISVACMIAISDYTAETGATRVVPGSHLLAQPPTYGGEFAEAVPVEFNAGSALLFDSQLPWQSRSHNQSFAQPFIRVVFQGYLRTTDRVNNFSALCFACFPDFPSL